MVDCGGWIKIHRKLLDSEVFKNPLLLKLWIWILCNAAYEEKETIAGGGVITLLPGEVIFKHRQLAEEIGVTRATLIKHLETLKNLQMVSILYTKRYTKLTALQWDKYQVYEPNSEPKGIPKCIPQLKKERKEAKERKNIIRSQEVKEIYKEKIFVDFAGGNERLLKALDDFTEMRKKMQKPMTDRAKQMLLSALTKLSVNPDEQIEILDQSTLNCWQSVYALKKEQKGKTDNEKFIDELKLFVGGA